MARKLSKKAQAERAAYEERLAAEREADLIDFERAQDTYHGKVWFGHVRWFDASSGEGVLTLSDGTSMHLHFSAIHGIDKNNYCWPTDDDRPVLNLVAGRTCKVIPYLSYGSRIMAAKVWMDQ